MEEKLLELLHISLIEMDRCPYVKRLSLRDGIKALKNEIEELEKAMNGDGDVKEELADVFRDALLLLVVAQKDRMAKIEEVLREAVAKVKRRKPFLWQDEEITYDDAVRIWYEEKAKEKKPPQK